MNKKPIIYIMLNSRYSSPMPKKSKKSHASVFKAFVLVVLIFKIIKKKKKQRSCQKQKPGFLKKKKR